MAAYAALVSVMHLIDEIEHHPRPPISFDKQQLQSLTANLTFLHDFLQGSHVNGGACISISNSNSIQQRIAEAAYAAEDAIESHIVDQLLGATTSLDFYQDLQKPIQDMDSIKKEVTMMLQQGVRNQLQRIISTSAAAAIASTGKGTGTGTGKNTAMVGFDAVMLELMDKLTDARPGRPIIPIVGMGGIGKTTLARNVCVSPLVIERFDISLWTAISQEYNMQEILNTVLSQDNDNLLSEDELGQKLHKYLSGRRYLIVLDDMWSLKAWDKIKSFFPDNNNGSRIIVTTRLSSLASQLAASGGTIDLALLDNKNSWTLFSETVFGREDGCPPELEGIGKGIVENCKGLPLLIVVIGGVLKNIEVEQECWESVRNHLNSAVNSNIDVYALKILKMSYDHLPVNLKPCFLYMGVFEEDHAIRVSTLVKLWVAEGFLRGVSGKSLETVAEEYLKELVDRNLILVHELGSTGNIKFCKIHDLLRDLSLREAEKERFYDVIKDSPESFLSRTISPGTGGIPNWEELKKLERLHDHVHMSQRRLVIPSSTSKQEVGLLSHRFSESKASRIRSFICDNGGVPPYASFRLLRTLREKYAHPCYLTSSIFELVNLRYLAVGTYPGFVFPSSIQLLWNLHTLIVDNGGEINAPLQIWNMSQLRHVQIFNRGLYLPDPPSHVIIMEKLQTLTKVWNFKCSEDVVRRIPNIKKLRVIYREVVEEGEDYYCLGNFECLRKLESLRFSVDASGSNGFVRRLTFPHSLKKLKLSASNFVWEDVLGKIGSLPLVQKLELKGGSFKTGKWETVQGQFRSLKFLVLRECGDLEWWTTESSSHFPVLEKLCLYGLSELKEIPSEIGHIATLKSFMLQDCSESAVQSAKRIVEEQEDLQGESFHVEALVQMKEAEALRSLAAHNFQVQVTKATTFWSRPCPSFPVSSWRPSDL